MGMMDILQSGPWAFYAGASPMASGANAFMQNFNQSQENERIKKIQEMQMQAQIMQMKKAKEELALSARARAKQEQYEKEISEFQQGLMSPQMGTQREAIPQMTGNFQNSGLPAVGDAELLAQPTKDVFSNKLDMWKAQGLNPELEKLRGLVDIQGKYDPTSGLKSAIDLFKNEENNKLKMDLFEKNIDSKIKELDMKNDFNSQMQKERLQNILDAIRLKASTPNINILNNERKKPLPYQAIKAINEEVENIGISKGIQSDLQGFVTQLDTGTLKLGPMENLKNTALNKANQSTEASRNYGSFMSNLEKLRNDSLRLNKGIQTEGDAQRAWKELISNVTDQKFVRQRLKEIQTINDRAIKLRQQKINNITKNYNKDDYDFSDIEDLPSATNLQSKPRFTIKKVK
jgi:hypothetical protein